VICLHIPAPRVKLQCAYLSYINSSRLGPKEFRDVLRFLAMDEPALLPHSSTATVETTALNARKRKFVEVPSTDGSFGDDLFKLGKLCIFLGIR
jgi:hypothetical protein